LEACALSERLRVFSPEFDFEHVASRLGLTRLLDRSPQALSGGERQRVAIGRALISRPALLLMDEPLSALDRAAKEEILPIIERLADDLRLPVVYVSHDMAEVERLADYVILMDAGRVQSAGSLELLQSDLDLPLARGRDAHVSIEGVVTGYDSDFGLMTVAVPGGSFLVPGDKPNEVNARRRISIASEDVSLSLRIPAETSILNAPLAKVLSIRELDARETLIVLGLGSAGVGSKLLARISRRSLSLLGLAEGTVVYAQIRTVILTQR
jgi:molybdate transport system ATP-binding protein